MKLHGFKTNRTNATFLILCHHQNESNCLEFLWDTEGLLIELVLGLGYISAFSSVGLKSRTECGKIEIWVTLMLLNMSCFFVYWSPLCVGTGNGHRDWVLTMWRLIDFAALKSGIRCSETCQNLHTNLPTKFGFGAAHSVKEKKKASGTLCYTLSARQRSR